MTRLRFFLLWLVLAFTCSAAFAEERVVPHTQAQMQLSFAPLVKSTAPSVVNVYATGLAPERQSVFSDPFFERFFGRESPFFDTRPREFQSLGSGVIVGSEGIILTNHHVVRGANDIRVSLADGVEYRTELVLADEKTDLSVLKIINPPPRGFPALAFSDDDRLEVGDLVLAIGNPFGVGQTVTSGIVSATARTGVGISDFQFFIQTDAAINPGNSGGALVNMRGELVGINTAIYSRSGGSNGIGFAIPASMAEFVTRSALSNGEIVRPWFGGRLQNVSADLARSLSLDRPRGALITDIYPKGPADNAGLLPGDVVLKIGTRQIENSVAFDFRFSTLTIGETVPVLVARNGVQVVLDLLLATYPDVANPTGLMLTDAGRFKGAQISNIGPRIVEEFDLPYSFSGVIISSVGQNSPAARMGLRVGDIILELNGRKIVDVVQMERIVQRPVRGWKLKIRRGNQLLNSYVNG